MSLEAFPQSRLAAIIESDLFYKFRTSWITVGAFVVTLVIVLAAVLAPWIAPHDPFDVSTLSPARCRGNSAFPTATSARFRR